jgi:hypothetical protein
MSMRIVVGAAAVAVAGGIVSAGGTVLAVHHGAAASTAATRHTVSHVAGATATATQVAAQPAAASAPSPASVATSDGATLMCAVVQAPAGQYDYHNGGWALEITVTVPRGSGEVFGPSGEIQIVEYDSSGTETGYESDDSSSWPIIPAGQAQSFYDISYDFYGSDPAETPTACQVVSP